MKIKYTVAYAVGYTEGYLKGTVVSLCWKTARFFLKRAVFFELLAVSLEKRWKFP